LPCKEELISKISYHVRHRFEIAFGILEPCGGVKLPDFHGFSVERKLDFSDCIRQRIHREPTGSQPHVRRQFAFQKAAETQFEDSGRAEKIHPLESAQRWGKEEVSEAKLAAT
jgi:hypothetical protein